MAIQTTATVYRSRPRRAWLGLLVVLFVMTLPASAGAQGTMAIPTFAKDVAPILQEHCQVCHRPGGGAPFALLTFDQARPWASAVKQKVMAREMPPWHVDKTTGISKYKNDISLSNAEIAIIVRWVDSGAPLGNPADLPAPKTFGDPKKWALGEPDLVLSPDTDHIMPAKGMDEWIDYLVDVPLKEDRWVKAIEVRPSDPAIVHHLAIWAEQHASATPTPQVAAAADAQQVASEGGSSLGDLLFTYAPGKGADVYEPNTGYLLKVGSRIRMAVHYSADGKPARDRSSVAFKFYSPGESPKYRVVSAFVSTSAETLEIPPNSVVTNDVYMRLARPTRIEAWSPHMHRRGKAITLEAVLPNGTRQVLSHVDRYAFNWQITYAFADDVAPLLPAGTLLHVITLHDNTAANRSNPDPSKWIGYGQGSNDEMAAAFVNYVYLDDADYEKLVAARKAAQPRSGQAQDGPRAAR